MSRNPPGGAFFTTGQPALAALILLCALAAVFGPSLLRGEFLFIKVVEDPNNLFSFYPWNLFSSRLYAAGYFPLYNPFNAFGTPHLANYQSAPLFPLHLVLFLNPTRLWFDLFMLGRLFILGFGVYFLARRLRMSQAAGVAAMLAVAFNGYFMRYASMVHLNTEMLLPWALLLTIILSEKRRFTHWALLSCLFAAGLMGGNAEAAMFLVLVSSMWAGWLAWGEGNVKIAVLSAAAIVAGAVISLAQTLPFLEYLPHAWHIHQSGSGREWLPLAGVVSLVAPDIFHSRVGFAPYGGAVALLLAIIGVGRGRHGSFFLLLAVLTLILIFGPPGTRWLGHLPVLSRTAALKYGFAPLGVALAVLAGFGLDVLLKGDIVAPWKGYYTAALVMALFLLCLVIAGRLTGRSMNLWGAGAALASLGLVASILALIEYNPSWSKFVAPAVAAVMWLELAAHFYGLQPRSIVNPEELRKTPQIQYLVEHKDDGVVAALPNAMRPNLNLLWEINDLSLFDALYPKFYVETMGKIFGFDMKNSVRYFKEHGYYFPPSPKKSFENSPYNDLIRFYLGRRFNGLGLETIMPGLYQRTSFRDKPLTIEKQMAFIFPNSLAASDGKLIIHNNWLPGWRAWSGDRELKLSKVAGGLFFSAPRSDRGGGITFRYEPWGFRVGLWAMLTSLLALTSALCLNTMNKRKKLI